MNRLFIIFMLLCTATTLLSAFGIDMTAAGYSEGCSAWQRFAYMFPHKSGLHLFGNMLSLAVLLPAVGRLGFDETKAMAASIAAAVISTAFTGGTEPTIGASALVYFLFGMLCAMSQRKLRIMPVVMLSAAINAVQHFYGGANVAVHAAAFFYGVLFNYLYILWNKAKKHSTRTNSK